MEKEQKPSYLRSFIQKSHLDRETGRWTADLDSRYGRDRKGLRKATALKMLGLDNVIATTGIKPGDQIDILIRVKEADVKTGKIKTVEKWQKPFDGEKFAEVHGGRLIFSVPDGANRDYSLPVGRIVHLRKHKKPEAEAKPDELPAESGRQRIDIMVERAGLKKGDSFIFEERRVAEDPKTGHPAESRRWLGVYGVVFDEVKDGQLMIRDATGAGEIIRPLSSYRDIKDINKAKPLPYPMSERKYLSQK